MNVETTQAGYPLSPTQQGMLFDYLARGEPGVDVVQVQCSLSEDLEISKFREAWEWVVSRHSALRTSFDWEGFTEPVQKVHPSVQVPFEILDWRHLPPDDGRSRLAAFLRSDRNRGFDLAHPPLLRLSLVRLGSTESVCVFTRHHIILDGAILPTILDEVYHCYAALCQGRQPVLPETLPYRLYIDWLQCQDWLQAEPHWRKLLQGFRAPSAIPSIPPTSVAGTCHDRRGLKEIRISVDSTSRLKDFATAHRLTPNTLFIGAWGLLLTRYTGEQDVVFGVTRACRRSSIEGAESVVGLFINTLPFRVKVSEDPPLVPWLRGLRTQWLAMRDFEHTPLPLVHGWSEIPADQPLFGSHLVFNNRSVDSILRARGGDWSNRRIQTLAQASLPLSVVAYLDDQLTIRIGFDRERFTGETIQQVLEHLRNLLESMIADPHQPISRVRMLSETERRRILLDWNDTAVDFCEESCLHGLVEKQAGRTPENVAVIFDHLPLTYRELNLRANQLANYLRRLGVGKEALVGIYMEPSHDLVVALLGVLKAGAAFLPLDSALPQARLGFMIRDSRAAVILTRERESKQLPGGPARVIRLDTERARLAEESQIKPPDEATPEDLAFVIYTSGSTGRPKAAMNTHRGVCNRLLALRNDFRLGESDTGLLKSTLSFDPSINETFWPLVSGGRLLILLAGEHRDISYLIGLIAEYEVTWINFVPSILRAFLDHPDSGRCRTLKYVVSGGEPLTFSLQRRFFSRMNAELHNVYGPTETAIGVTRWKCQQNGGSRIIPIGRPHANTRIYILDSRLEPVPVGVSGELHIGGVQVGRGYLNQPELTAEKFIPDPFCGEDGARLFKTGDVARYLPGGNIEFLERKDHQVKIRGVRIELGEIEACLEEHEMVSQAVVKVRDHGSENAKLVAYLTAKHEIQPGRLRAWLSERLPPEMLPARFIRLESFPLTSSQKLDRDALPPPPADKLVAAAEADGPRNESERQLLSIWEEVLRIEAPGIHDSFFALGGHSLLAQQVMNRLYHVTGRQYSVALLFRNPTVARMARKLAEMSSEDLGS